MTAPPGPARVLELGAGAATAFAARLFAQLGADVVKVELLPDGDPHRRDEPVYHAVGGAAPYSVAFHFLNQGKRSIAVDPAESSMARILTGLFDWCEVAIVDEKFAAIPVVGNLLTQTDSAVRTVIKPFGSTGPYADYEATAGAVFAMGGELFMLPGGLGYRLFPDAPPLLVRGNAADFDGGVIGALVSLAAMYHEDSRAEIADVSSVEASVSLNRWLVSHFDDSGWVESRDTRSYPYAGMFECADGYAMIQPSTEHHWTNLVTMMGSPKWALKPEYATRNERNLAGKEISGQLRKWMKSQTKKGILASGLQHGVPAAPFRNAEEVLGCPQFSQRKFFVQYGTEGDGSDSAPPSTPGLPFELAPFGPRALNRAPDLGEHTTEILEMLSTPPKD